MPILDTITSTLSSVIPGGFLFHPTFKITKVAEGQYDFSWGIADAAGTYHLSLTFVDTQFIIKGDTVIIPSDSVFPFSVVAPMINGWLSGAATSALDVVASDPVDVKAPVVVPVKKGMSYGTHRAITQMLSAKVGDEVVVPAVTEVPVEE